MVNVKASRKESYSGVSEKESRMNSTNRWNRKRVDSENECVGEGGGVMCVREPMNSSVEIHYQEIYATTGIFAGKGNVYVSLCMHRHSLTPTKDGSWSARAYSGKFD